jgi:hypothetical protein
MACTLFFHVTDHTGSIMIDDHFVQGGVPGP